MALFIALGGTGYAAINVGKHAINPSNLNGRYIGGYVSGFVRVDARGHVIASAGAANVKHLHAIPAGNYAINWPGPR